MPNLLRAATLVRELESEDFRVLKGIELGMRRHEFVPLAQISFYSKLNENEVLYRLGILHKHGILQRNSQIGYIGYQLISESYDILALHALEKKDIIEYVGDYIARGKESDVFFAKTVDGTECAIKIHRLGQNSFRSVRKLRSYIKNRKHISWLYVSRLSAESEYEALKLIEPLELPIPKAIIQNRHILVMDLVNGNQLNLIQELDNPREILDELLNIVKILFIQAKLIHCDLSEFNILITPEQKVQLIDFPQWESSDHPNSLSYLTRDLKNVHHYFSKKYNLTFDIEEIIQACLHPES